MLWARLMVNDKQIGHIEIQRIEPIHVTLDTITTYRWNVRQDADAWAGTIAHRYGDGALALLREVLTEATAQQVAERIGDDPELAAELARLEADDPAVREAARRVDEALQRASRATDYCGLTPCVCCPRCHSDTCPGRGEVINCTATIDGRTARDEVQATPNQVRARDVIARYALDGLWIGNAQTWAQGLLDALADAGIVCRSEGDETS